MSQPCAGVGPDPAHPRWDRDPIKGAMIVTSHLSACVDGPVRAPGELLFRTCHRTSQPSVIIDHADPVIWIAEPTLSFIARRDHLPGWMLRTCRMRLPDHPGPAWDVIGVDPPDGHGVYAITEGWPRSRISSMYTRWHGCILEVHPAPPCPTLAPQVADGLAPPQRLVYRITGRCGAGTGIHWEARWPD